MLQLEKNMENGIYNFSFEEDINIEILNQFYQQVELKSNEGKHLKILGILRETPSLKDFNIFKNAVLSRSKAFQNNIKYAILTDQEWMFKLEEVTRFFTPNISLKVFPINDKQTAINWLKK